ncbi:MAG: class I SAM-dependent methyltransferase [Vicinamibacterales bacterium]
MPRGDYGYDAPYALAMFTAGGVISAVVSFAEWWNRNAHVAAIMAGYAAFFLGNALSFWYTTRRGKFQVWDEVLDGLRLGGDERVLYMGCGRGAVLTAVARRLTSGRVTGIDLWSTNDQSGNARDVTLRNAALEGVRDRVDVETGNMRALPFEDAAFDLVVSSLAIHNISSNAGRAQAVAEAWRVLKPGGRLVIADIRATSRYAGALRALGARSVTRRGLGYRFWYGNPLAATAIVFASKSVRE